MKPAFRLTFRQWLVKQVVVLRWTAPPQATLPQIAEHLGVTVSVLEEAQALREAEARRRGKSPRAGGKRALFRTDQSIAHVTMPPEIRKAWLEYVAVLQITSSALLRSLVHHFLLTGDRPQSISRSWKYRGQVYKIKLSGNAEVSASITLGADVALSHYAALWGVKAMAILRGLVTDLLEGRVKKLRIVAFSELWGDPDRYLRPELFTR